MSVASLTHRDAFGANGTPGTVHFLDETNALFTAGNVVVIQDMESKAKRFLPCSENCEGISAVAISPNRRYVAIAESGKKATISIYDLTTMRKKRTLVSQETSARSFVSVAFSPEGRFVLAQTAAPEWMLMYWSWEKSPKVLASMKTCSTPGNTITQVMFSPTDATYVSVVGNGVFKVYRYSEGTLKQQVTGAVRTADHQHLCHTWVSADRIVVGTASGRLLLYEGAELKATIPTPHEGLAVASITATSKGFVCGGDQGLLCTYERVESREYFRAARVMTLTQHPHRIHTVSLSPTEEQVLCACAGNQLYVASLNPAASTAGAVGLSAVSADHGDGDFEVLAQPFHSSSITGLDVCVRKPLVATCSTDRSVRVWNYMDASCEVHKTFSEEAYCVALHPSGLHVVVGFADKLRLMNLLMDDIRTVREFGIRSCREVRFSNGGHLFAAANGNNIQVFNTYTWEAVANLRGHNAKVQSLVWAKDDTRLVSAGMDGAVYQWSLAQGKRVAESVIKTCSYTCVTLTPDARYTYAVGSDNRVKEISESTVTRDFPAGDPSAPVLTQIAISRSGAGFFAGTSSGSVRAYKYPMTGEFHEHQAHLGAVTRIRVSHDETTLFTAGADGILYAFAIDDDAEGGASGGSLGPGERVGARDAGKDPSASFSEEILITRSDIDEQSARMQELREKVSELTLHNEYQLRLKAMDHDDKLKEVKDKYAQELEAWRTKYEVLLQEKNDQEAEYEDRFREVEERHRHTLGARDSEFQNKIAAELERYQSVVQDKAVMQETYERRLREGDEMHQRVVQELTEDYENKLQEDVVLQARANDEKDELIREFEETKKQLEEDADREIEDLKHRYEAKLAQERQASLRLKGENGIMKKKFHALQKDIEDSRVEILQLFGEKKQLCDIIASLEKDIVGIKKEIKERDETIGDKEKRIYDLKKKNQELEKFKFVLDYKILELKKKIEPREMEIADMKEQIKDMDHELERYNHSNRNLTLTIEELRLKVTALNKEIAAERRRTADTQAIVRRFRNDLHECVQDVQEPKRLKEGVKLLYRKHVTQHVSAPGQDEDIQREHQRQREYLERSNASLRRKLAKDAQLLRGENVRVMQENVALIEEINHLRRELRTLRSQRPSVKAPPVGLTGGPRGSGPRPPSSSRPSSAIAAAGSGAMGASTINTRKKRTSSNSISFGVTEKASVDSADPARERELSDKIRELSRVVDLQRSEAQRRGQELVQARESIAVLEARAAGVTPRAMSRERLPPMDGKDANVPPTSARIK